MVATSVKISLLMPLFENTAFGRTCALAWLDKVRLKQVMDVKITMLTEVINSFSSLNRKHHFDFQITLYIHCVKSVSLFSKHVWHKSDVCLL